MIKRRALWPRLAFLALFPALLRAAEPSVDPKELPRIPPTEPAAALATFRLKAGFRLELVAAEPLVVDPTALAFDENGRLFVVEMRDYSERRPERLGRIRLLEDIDGDGRFEKSTVFADDLPWPTAVTCYAGGIFVGSTPDILYFKDIDDDGRADLREVIFTGFASDYAPFATNKLNVQALMNSLQWGPDNRVHGATSMSGGKVHLAENSFTRRWRERGMEANSFRGGAGRNEGRRPGTRMAKREIPDESLDLRGRDFSFDPRTLEMRAESGGGQHGMSFDNRGRKFVCSNSDHIQLIMYEDRYAARNPYFGLPGPRVSIAVDGPAAEVYRVSPDEPWRVIRTAWRVAGKVSGPVEGGGRASGYFTGATGVTIYRGNAFPENYRGDAFIADCGSNLIHRKKLRPDGVLLKASRPADEEKIEFLASTDNWFRPVQFANAPDGCLYLADMYREVIEHPWSLPPTLKKHLDLNSGNDRGRIYRIVPQDFKQPKLPRLGRYTTVELVETLEHPNGWHRDTAARLLYERMDNSGLSALEKLAAGKEPDSRDSEHKPFARLQALDAIDGLKALTEAHVRSALASTDAAVRVRALKLSETFLSNPSEAMSNSLCLLAGAVPQPERDASVDFQLALTLGQLRTSEKLEVLRRFLRRLQENGSFGPWQSERTADPDQKAILRWILPALVNSLGEDAVEVVRGMASSGSPRFPGASPEMRRALLPPAARLIGARNQSNEVTQVLTTVANLPASTGREGSSQELRLVWEILAGLEEGLSRNSASLKKYETVNLKGVFREAGRRAVDSAFPIPEERLAAIQVLACAAYIDVRSNLLALIFSSSDSPNYRLAALEVLGRFGDAEVGTDLLRSWPELTPALRVAALELLLKRPERTRSLVSALRDKVVRPSELSTAQINFLRKYRDEKLRVLIIEALGDAPSAARKEVVETFLPALKLPGDAKRGQSIYLGRCSTCHRLGSEGHALGPDLASVKSSGKEKMLVNILDPNREVAPNYLSYLVETKEGETLTGLIGNETAASVTLRQANSVETVVLRSNIARMQSQGLSVMPEGLETGLSQQEIADLLEFIAGP